MQCCGVDGFFDAVNKISICGIGVISNLTVCAGDGVSSTFLAVMRCSLTFFCGVAVFAPPPPPHAPLSKCIENWIDVKLVQNKKQKK